MNSSFQYYVETEGFHFKYAKGAPSAVGREFHGYAEFILFINGEARFVSKNIQQRLSRGNLIMVPKGEFHQFSVEKPEEYTRCIFGFRETESLSKLVRAVMPEVMLVEAPNPRIVGIFEEMIATVRSSIEESEKKMFLEAALVQLLILCKQYSDDGISHNLNITPEVRAAMDYIDAHYTERLSVERIAREIHVSSSTLAHKFTRALNISVYRYLLKKRLAAAQERIRAGESLAGAATASGFCDYSCFYRVYKKYCKEL
ncbi:MAG: helix-turn-helix transcriptional regulator [Clostridia bacterium]|nr:helix-turn-helix transcriptional regulator [Clostridia bacterium]